MRWDASRRFDLLRKAAEVFGDSPWLLTPGSDTGNPFSAITYKQVRKLRYRSSECHNMAVQG